MTRIYIYIHTNIYIYISIDFYWTISTNLLRFVEKKNYKKLLFQTGGPGPDVWESRPASVGPFLGRRTLERRGLTSRDPSFPQKTVELETGSFLKTVSGREITS